MVGPNRPAYCGNCGSLVQAGDRFCGVCGAGVSGAATPAAPTREIPAQVVSPPSASSRRRLPKSWWMVGVGSLAILVIGIGILAVAASGGEMIEPLPGLSAEVPEGWAISSESNQSGQIGDSGATILVPEEYRASEYTSNEVLNEGASIYLREADAGECDPQPIQVESQPEVAGPSATLGGYDDFLTAEGSIADGEIAVDGNAATWSLAYLSIASPLLSYDEGVVSEYPNYSGTALLKVCVEGPDLVAEYGIGSTLFGSSVNTTGQPTVDFNASVPEARERVHRELRERYEAHFGAMEDFVGSINTGGWGGRTNLDELPATLDPYEDVWDDPFDGQLQEVATSPSLEEPTEPTTSPSDQADTEAERLEEFGRDYYEASASEDWETTYSMLSDDSQQRFTEEEWSEKQQILRDEQGTLPFLASVTVEPDEEVSDSPATVTLRYVDGTEEAIMAMIPMVVESGEDFEPKRYLTEDEISELEQVTTFASASPSTDDSEAGAEEAAEKYYQAAGIEDWGYTYEHLDSVTQSMFTEEEWFQKNQYYWDLSSITYDVLSVEVVYDSEELLTEVTVRITGEAGSSFIRTTYWVMEDGEWLHRFSQEEIDLFMPDLSYEEFVEAQG